MTGFGNFCTRFAPWLAGIGAVGLLILGPLYSYGVLGLQSALLRGVPASLLFAVLGALLGLLGLIFGKGRAGRAILAMVVGAAVAWLPVSLIMTARQVPAIHDITTDTQDPPAFVDIAPLRTGEGINPPEYAGKEVADQQLEAYPDLESFVLPGTMDAAFEKAVASVSHFGWEMVGQDRATGRIEATETTRWFSFKDDIVMRLRQTNAGVEVDVRSKSRVGRSDIGVNAKRIRALRDYLTGSS